MNRILSSIPSLKFALRTSDSKWTRAACCRSVPTVLKSVGKAAELQNRHTSIRVLAAGSALLLAAAAPHTAAPGDATVALTTQPGSALETTAMQLVSADLKQARGQGDQPVMLVGSAHLSTSAATPAALFVQVQSASFCGSAGCSTSVYVKHGAGWTKVMDSISGPIKVSRRNHHGMRDLLVHGHDRWTWNGTAYADTLPTPDVDLRHSVKKDLSGKLDPVPTDSADDK